MLRNWVTVTFLLLFFLLPDFGYATVQQWRPLKSYFAKINTLSDEQKVMAGQSRSGWTISSNLIVGPYKRSWVGAYDLKSLEPVWWVEDTHDLTGPVATFGRYVVLGYRDGTVKKIEATNGKLVWSTRLGSYMARAPILNGSTLFASTVRQQVYALDFQSGELKWFYEAGIPENITVQGAATPVIQGGILYFGSSEGEVHALNVATGKLLWRKDPEYSLSRFMDIVGEMFIQSGKLYVTRSDGLVAGMKLGLGEPETTWVEKLPNLTTSRFRNGRLYVGGLNGSVYAYEIVNGRQVWKFNSGDTVVALTVMQDTLVVLGAQGRVTFVDLDTGHVKWHEDLYGHFNNLPVVFEGNIYFFSGLDVVYGFKL